MVVESAGRASAVIDRAPSAGTPKTKRQYFPELQGIRAIAVLLMVVLHTSLTAGTLYYTGHNGAGFFAVLLERVGRESLPIMFALSGMLIFRPFALNILAGASKPGIGSYAWRRVLRIVPGFWLVSLVILLTLDWKNITGLWYVVRVATMQHVYNTGGIPSGMEQTWSMATETAFYVLVPLLAWLCTRITRGVTDTVTKAKRMLIPMAGIILVGYAFTAWSHQASFGPWDIQGNFPPGWFGYLAIGMGLAVLSAVAEEIPGKFLGWYKLAASKPLLCWGLAASITALFCFSPFGDQGTANYPGAVVSLVNQPIDLLIVTLIMAPLTIPAERSRFIKAVLTWKPLVFLAKISYGIYLWHIAIIYWLLGGLLGQHNWFLAQIIVIGASSVLATISYYRVERPALKLRGRLGKSSTEPGVAVLVRN